MRDLSALIPSGAIILVHASLSSLGWVCGGAQTLVEALLRVLGPEGTMVMPAQSGELSDPRHWEDPVIPSDWWSTVRANLPAYDPRTTPTRGMGAVAEAFRQRPGVWRSAHPAQSFAAHGPRAQRILREQMLDDPFGDPSPLSHLYAADARIVMLGTGFDTCTALHLAERRADPDAPRVRDGAPVMMEGRREWVTFDRPVYRDGGFEEIGEALDKLGLIEAGRVGFGTGRVLRLRQVVDLAERRWARR